MNPAIEGMTLTQTVVGQYLLRTWRGNGVSAVLGMRTCKPLTKRTCMRCGKTFYSESRFNRVCDVCHQYHKTIPNRWRA